MKRMLLSVIGLMMVLENVGEELPAGMMVEVVDGITWYYLPRRAGTSYSSIEDPDEVSIGYSSSYSTPYPAVPTNTVGAIVIPSSLGGKTVTVINSQAFKDCKRLTSVTVPSSVISIGATAFDGCRNLTSVVFQGDAPDVVVESYSGDIFSGTPKRLVVSVPYGSIGWNGGVTTPLPESWHGRAIVHDGESYDWDGGRGTGVVTATLIVTNAIIHYIVNSVRPEKAIPATMDTGFVNIITEVKSGGAVSVPETWSQNYSSFAEKYGSDFTKALMKPTGKRDGAGNEMLVWQDYVAGTDPTDENDVFTAAVTIVEGKPVVSYTPELTEEETANRIYKTWGKVRLQDADWSEASEATIGNLTSSRSASKCDNAF